MQETREIVRTIKNHKNLFIIVLVGLFLIELEIFAVAAMKSGRKSMLQIADPTGNVVFLSEGATLSQIDKSSFEKTFGPLEHYRVKILTEERSFPFRAWFVAAVGLPVGVVLLLAFVIKAWTSLFVEGQQQAHAASKEATAQSAGLERIVHVVSRFNVFIVGVLVFFAVIAYWILPNFFVFIGRTGIETVARFKWGALAVSAVLVAVVVWVIYLRYLLARKSIDSHVEVEKYRLQLEHQKKEQHQITYEEKPSTNPPEVTHNKP